jgi:hypothetical protein
MEAESIRALVREAIQEFLETQKTSAEPAYQTELGDERKRREELERKVNELAEENRRNRARAEEAERNAAIRGELQGLGVTKIDLAFRAVRDDIVRTEDGRLVARVEGGEASVRDYLARFVADNPELLPARIPGGSGSRAGQRPAEGTGGADLDRIRPGMDPEEMERVRQEIAKIASQTLRGV